MSKKTNKVGQRLRVFGESKFGSMAAFARALDFVPQNLTPYLNGSQLPGNKLQTRLRELGCDIEWLMTGGPDHYKKRDVVLVIKDGNDPYILSDDIPKKTREKIKKMIAELSKLDETQIDQAEAVIKTIFPKIRKEKKVKN